MKKRSKIIKCSLLVFFLLFQSVSLFSASEEHVLFERAKSRFKKGIYYFNNMNYLAAVEFFRKSVSLYSEYHLAREYLARAYKLSGFYEEAAIEWELLFKSSQNVSVKDKVDTIRYRQVAGEFVNTDKNYIYLNSIYSSNLSRFRFPNPSDLITDMDKNIYITSFRNGKIVKLSSVFNGEDVKEPDSDSKIYGIDYQKGKIVYSDFSKDRVFITDNSFNEILNFGGSGSGQGKFHGPEGVRFDSSGYIYVVDSGNNRVQKFDNNGKYVLSFGKKGEYEGELKKPSGVAVHKGMVYITDTANKRLSVFDDSGNYIKSIKFKGLEKPKGIDYYNNKLLISDVVSGLIIYSLDDKTTKIINNTDKKEKISRAISSTIDSDGYLYILDYSKEAVHLFSPLSRQYSNLDVEITSVDISQYPSIAFYLNIRDKAGNPVTGLKRSNFKISEDKARIRTASVDYFQKIKPSNSIILCVDRSPKIEKWHNDIPWALDFILKKCNTNDKIQVLNFNSSAWIENKFDWSRRRTLKALKRRKYSRGKNYGKVLYGALSTLAPEESRRGIVLVTDGLLDENSFSKYSVNNIINYAKSNYIPIYFISLSKKNSTLEKIARSTGGEYLKIGDLSRLKKIYSKIKRLPEYRYMVSYSTLRGESSYDGWWSDVNIEVNYKGQKGIEWGGYFVPKK